MCPTSSRRPALRLVEVLVVTVIVIIGVGLLLPIIPRARYDAVNTLCRINNKQLGLAVHNYASAYQIVLPSLTSDVAKSRYGAYNGGILVTLLPYLEQEILFNDGAMRLPSCTWCAPVPPNSVLLLSTSLRRARNGEPMCTLPIGVYQCPIDVTINKGFSGNQADTDFLVALRIPSPGPRRVTRPIIKFSGRTTTSARPSRATTAGPSTTSTRSRMEWPTRSSSASSFRPAEARLAACGPTPASATTPAPRTRSPGARAPSGVKQSIVNTPTETNSNLWAPVFANGNASYGFTAGGAEG